MTGAGRISARWLRAAPAQRVCAMLEEAGHSALFVGGCVRNALIGAPVSDLDLATDATPERVIALEGAQDVLARDVARVDMRLAQRPTVQMNKDATQELWRIRQISGQ